MIERSEWLQYLPSPYQDDAFTRRFLLIFEAVFRTLEGTVDALPEYFDPRLAPEALLPYLASWVGAELDENWPIARQRQFILWAARLYRWRGTRRGLQLHLQLYTGLTPLIVEDFGARPHSITITVLADNPAALEERILHQIVNFQKPAHVGYTLEVRRPDSDAVEVSP